MRAPFNGAGTVGSRCLFFGSQFERFLVFSSSFKSLASDTNFDIENNKKKLCLVLKMGSFDTKLLNF